MSVVYVQVSPGILKKGDTVYEVVQYGQNKYKYNEGKVIQLLGDKAAQVSLVGSRKTAKIPFKDLAVGSGLYEARTNPASSKASRLERFKEHTVGGDEPVEVTKITAVTPINPAPVVPPEKPVGLTLVPDLVPSTPPPAPTTAVTPQDEFSAWLSIGVDFLPVLEKRIADREAELNTADATMEALANEHKAQVAEAERVLTQLKNDLLNVRTARRNTFDEQRKQLDGWKHVRSLLRPLTGK